MVTLAHDGLGRMKLDGRCELELSELENTTSERVGDDDVNNDQTRGARANGKEKNVHREKKGSTTTTTVVTGYTKHLRLRTLPPQLVSPRTVRMCYNDTT